MIAQVAWISMEILLLFVLTQNLSFVWENIVCYIHMHFSSFSVLLFKFYANNPFSLVLGIQAKMLRSTPFSLLFLNIVFHK